jgi:hypothetical protein
MVWIKTNTLFIAGEQRRNERCLPLDQAVRRTDRGVAGGVAPNHGVRGGVAAILLMRGKGGEKWYYRKSTAVVFQRGLKPVRRIA